MLALGVGGIGAIVMLAGGYVIVLEQALRSYLIGFIFWVGIGIGSLGVLLLQHVTGGAWGVVLRRIVEAGARTLLPWGLILSLPILFGIPIIYHQWYYFDPNDAMLLHKSAYLNQPFFAIRTVLYFFIWGGVAYLLTSWSRKQDENGDLQLLKKMTRFSGPIIVLFVLLVTFASVDWAMSLDARF